MSSTVALEWTFSPSDFFEIPITICRDDYTLTIVDGKARAVIVATRFDASLGMRESLQTTLENRFLADQLISRRPFELSESTMVQVDADGRQQYYLNVRGIIHTQSASTLDLRVIDNDGDVTADTKQDRIRKKETFAGLVTKHQLKDQLLGSMLESFNAAIRDPQNELTHLYEIREGLAKHYGSESGARCILAISVNDWSQLGKICNHLPLKQGRHRGTNVATLRDALVTELDLARNIAQSMIEAHLKFLENAIRS